MRDLMNNLDCKRGISPAAAVADNTPFVSQIVDLQGSDSAMFVILSGALADPDATFTALVEHGEQANLSDATAVPDEGLNGTEALAGFNFGADDKVFKIGYRGDKRYARVTITPANNTGNVFVAGVWILGHQGTRPAANPPA